MVYWLLAAVACAMALVQDIIPGRPLYHAGWYNALGVALIIIAARPLLRGSNQQRIAFTGAVLIVLAGAASGLMGPDTQLIVGAPGATIETADFGTIRFPLQAQDVPSRRYSLDAVFTAVPRDVVHVDAFDARGNHVTLTQPSGATFLSPVLLMQQTAEIAGMSVRTDEFSLPALSRTVKAVYFTSAQAALLHSDAIAPGTAAVLFDVGDARGRSVAHGIALVASGTRVDVGGVALMPQVVQFPGIEAASAPFAPFVIAGILLLAAAGVRSLSRSKT